PEASKPSESTAVEPAWRPTMILAAARAAPASMLMRAMRRPSCSVSAYCTGRRRSLRFEDNAGLGRGIEHANSCFCLFFSAIEYFGPQEIGPGRRKDVEEC